MGRNARRRHGEITEAEVIQHVLENQIEPQRIADELREEGHDVEVGWVNTGKRAKGFTVSCHGCGRTAKSLIDPGTRKGLCPDCVRAVRS
jgi:hypothetical protein